LFPVVGEVSILSAFHFGFLSVKAVEYQTIEVANVTHSINNNV